MDEVNPDQAWSMEIASWENNSVSYDNEDGYNDLKDVFEVGKIVKLNSGGPLMTIEKICDDVITCIWFDKNYIIQSNDFTKPLLYIDYSCIEPYSQNTNDEAFRKISEIDINEDEIPY